MEKEFVTYELALRLKQLGFDEPCFGFWLSNKTMHIGSESSVAMLSAFGNVTYFKAPLYQQAFKWFRENQGWIGSVWQCSISEEAITSFEYAIDRLNDLGVSQYRQNFPYKTYEEAELDCLEGLIEIIEQEKK